MFKKLLCWLFGCDYKEVIFKRYRHDSTPIENSRFLKHTSTPIYFNGMCCERCGKVA